MCSNGQAPDNLDSCVPRPVESEMLLRVQLPQSRYIESSGVDTEKLDDQLWFIRSKLLEDLVHIAEENSPLAKNISFCFRGAEGRVQLCG